MALRSQLIPSMAAAPTPSSVCILRLSALGDVTHVVPVVRRLQEAWPATRLTWVIGRPEHKLLGDLAGVEFLVFDKRGGLREALALRRALRGRRFDVLLHFQPTFRANLVSTLVPARLRLGYDRRRSKELHGLCINRRTTFVPRQHVLDAFGGYLEALGLERGAPRWDLPIPAEARAWAEAQLPGPQPTLAISPCSSHSLRNWSPERTAAVAAHAISRHGFRVVLCGGRSGLERETGERIRAALRAPVIDLIGRDTLKQSLALLERAHVLLAPDSGPMHFANAVGTKVIGLHAATDARRSGPYSDLRYSINKYEEAALRFMGRPASALPWGKRVEFPGVMDLIGVEEVIAAFDRYVADAAGPGPER